MTDKELRELIAYVDSVAFKLFMKYKEIYLSNSQDLDDLKGISHIVLVNMMNNKKFNELPFREFMIICGRGVRYELGKVRRDAWNRWKTNEQIPTDMDINQIESGTDERMEIYVSLLEEEIEKTVNNKQDSFILIKRDIEGETFQNIAKKLNLSKPYVYRRYKQLRDKFTKIFKKSS